MSRQYSLKDLRDSIDVETRNNTTNPRYTSVEIDLSIERATLMLGEYFFAVETDSTASWVDGTYSYEYSFPVEDIFLVEFVPSSGPPSQADDWREYDDGDGTTLFFNDDHKQSETIRVWYERHPYPYPSDGASSASISISDTSVISTESLADWPDSGFCKMESEILRYTAIDRTSDTITIVRGQLGTAASTHATETPISYVNKVDKSVFYNGIRDVAIMYLNRMRVIDAPSSDIAGNVTVMREIQEGLRNWVRTHRMRQSRPIGQKQRRSQPMRGRTRGK